MEGIGYKSSSSDTLDVTTGIFASEGIGVYLSLGEDLAKWFSGKYLFKASFIINNPLNIINEPLYALEEHDDLEEPLQDKDSPWLKANKLAFQDLNGTWDGISLFKHLTVQMKKMGYDGVYVESGGEKWVVVFNPKNVKLIGKSVID